MNIRTNPVFFTGCEYITLDDYGYLYWNQLFIKYYLLSYKIN